MKEMHEKSLWFRAVAKSTQHTYLTKSWSNIRQGVRNCPDQLGGGGGMKELAGGGGL